MRQVVVRQVLMREVEVKAAAAVVVGGGVGGGGVVEEEAMRLS